MSARSGEGRVALVTGGSRGVGQGIAVGLAEAGWTVHVSGRNADRLARTAEKVAAVGGTCTTHSCDHSDDADVAALVAAVESTEDRLDLLVNNVWAGPRLNPFEPEKFYERPLSDWDSLITVGLRAHYVAAHAAVPGMVARGEGLVVNITSIGARSYLHSALYGMGKAALDKMTHDLAVELRGTGVTMLSLWPGLVRTELLLASGLEEFEGVKVTDSETPELQGRVLAAVAADPRTPERSGTALLTAELCAEYGIYDEGATPVSPRTMFGLGPGHDPVGA